MTLATLLLPPVLAITGAAPRDPVTGSVVLAMLVLRVRGSGLAYVWNFRVISRAGATTASSVTHLTPWSPPRSGTSSWVGS